VKQYALDSHARVEIGFRIQATQANYRELDRMLPGVEKTKWARTSKHPGGASMYMIPGDMDENGRIGIPPNTIEAFTRFEGFIMAKLVTPLPSGHFSTMAIYGKPAWEFDKVSPKRSSGDWVYSMPIYGLEKAGEGVKFFFIIRLDREVDGKYVLTVDKITVTRGKEHFSIGRKTYGPFQPTSADNLVGVAVRHKETVRTGPKAEDVKEVFPLKDLPLAEALAQASKR
jgi:hypothetical protein